MTQIATGVARSTSVVAAGQHDRFLLLQRGGEGRLPVGGLDRQRGVGAPGGDQAVLQDRSRVKAGPSVMRIVAFAVGVGQLGQRLGGEEPLGADEVRELGVLRAA